MIYGSGSIGVPWKVWLSPKGIADTVAAGESHGAQAAAVEAVQKFLPLCRGEAQPAVAAGADDGGVRGGGVRCCE